MKKMEAFQSLLVRLEWVSGSTQDIPCTLQRSTYRSWTDSEASSLEELPGVNSSLTPFRLFYSVVDFGFIYSSLCTRQYHSRWHPRSRLTVGGLPPMRHLVAAPSKGKMIGDCLGEFWGFVPVVQPPARGRAQYYKELGHTGKYQTCLCVWQLLPHGAVILGQHSFWVRPGVAREGSAVLWGWPWISHLLCGVT